MAYWAKVKSGKVVKVISADESFFETFVDDSPGRWIETFKDRSQRVHFAGIGYNYDATADVFYPNSPFTSWTLNTTSYVWEPPTAYPTDGGNYVWNEDTTSWDVVS